MSEHSEHDDRQRTPPQRPDEPVYLPSQAEGEDGDEEEMNLHLRTGGKAEGTEEDVDEQLKRQEKKDRQQPDR